MQIDSSWYQKPQTNITLRKAAGGVVIRMQQNTLLVSLTRQCDRPNYILPKGGIDLGETAMQAARREIREEAGFEHLQLLDTLGETARLNFKKTRWVHTHYFLFVTDEIEVKPLEFHKYASPHWFPIDQLPTLFWPDQTELIKNNRGRIIELATQQAVD